MRVPGCYAATMRAGASVLALFLLAATREAAMVQSNPPAQVSVPEDNSLRANMTARFNGSLEASIGGCNKKTATAIAEALAPHISENLVDGAIGTWQRYDEFTGGRHIGVRVGLGKEFLGYANGQPVADRWINFQVNVGVLGPRRGCNR
jgi:hypothetical protein